MNGVATVGVGCAGGNALGGACAAEEPGCTPERRDGVVWRPWHEVAEPLVREAPAKVTPMETTTVAAEVAGQVMSLPVRVGDRVCAGAVIAELDPTPLRLAVEEAKAAAAAAEARVAQARRQLDQARRLLAERVGNRDSVATAEEQLTIAERDAAVRAAQLEEAQWRLVHAQVRAPYDGVVAARLAQVGDGLAPARGSR